MRRFNVYLLKHCVRVVAGLMALALAILLLERLLQIFELVANTSNVMGITSRMVASLIPFYVGLAMPVGFFLGVLMTVDRLSRSGELSAALAAGLSHMQIMRPFLVIASILAVLSIVISGYIQPLTRYDYRATVDYVKQTSFESAFQEGQFARIGARTVWTETRAGAGELGAIFIYEDNPGEARGRVTTAAAGVVFKSAANKDETRVFMQDGQAVTVSPDRAEADPLTYHSATWTVGGDVTPFRPRGVDEHELTLSELIVLSVRPRPGGVASHVAATGAHAVIGRAVLLFLLPFVAFPMGLGYGRSYQSAGIALGIGFLGVTHEALELGRDLAVDGAIAPWLSTWPVIIVIAGVGAGLFLRSALRVTTPPLMLLSIDMKPVLEAIISGLRQGLDRLMRPFWRSMRSG